ncbi:hypothetical protein SOVF_148720 isoform B [Spinacia oleracea]|nr:hypothetical protein SOVF_148720 isoform B [Spinacia oleracea]
MSLELGKEGLKNCWRKIMLPSDHHLKSHHSGQDRLEESSGTHVLIPVPGGLVEMYSTKHVEEDESVLDYVKG